MLAARSQQVRRKARTGHVARSSAQQLALPPGGLLWLWGVRTRWRRRRPGLAVARCAAGVRGARHANSNHESLHVLAWL
eukprot:COSAG01_NODE_5203_length_4414_cov_3.702897_6_plen_79_part_00